MFNQTISKQLFIKDAALIKSSNRILVSIFFFTFFSLFTSHSTAQWSQIAAINTPQLNAVKFFDEHTGIIVGQGGIWRSTNSGVNWTQMLTGQNINALSFFDYNNGYAVGDSGKIFRTYDNGLNWIQQGIGITSNNLYGAIFSTSFRFHAVGSGGIILRTFTGGSTWTSQNLNGGLDFYSVVMSAEIEGKGFAVGSPGSERVYSTINGGTNWLSMLSLNGNSCFDVSFINNTNNILIVGNSGRIRKSTNSGINWTFPQSNVNVDLTSVTFFNSTIGYLAGKNGIILRTTDGGNTWSNQNSGFTNDLKDITFINEQTGWAVGQNGIVLRTGIPVYISISQNEIPKKSKLYYNFPNPFNPITIIMFDVWRDEKVKIEILDLRGSFMIELIDAFLKRGKYTIEFDGSNYSSGIYIIKMTSKDFGDSRKMVLIK